MKSVISFMIGFAIMESITTRSEIHRLKIRVEQLESATKAQSLINQNSVQLRENP